MPKSRNEVIADYIQRSRGWNPSEYRIESRPSENRTSDIVAVIHLNDEASPHPGAGSSIQLYLDRVSHQVQKELAGQ
jgi:hypothetical protein